MKPFPDIVTLENGCKGWQHAFDAFRVKVIVPPAAPLAEIVNFGFNAPYLLVFAENEMTLAQAAAYADAKGFSAIASQYSTSVVFLYPTCEGGWDSATEQLFIDLVAESRIGPYYQDGVFRSKERFGRAWGDLFIRGAIFRTHLFGTGKSADYIARCCLKTLSGLYLWGPGEITATSATLENLSLVPSPERRDIPVVSVGNSAQVNAALAESCDHLLVQQAADVPAAFDSFLRGCKRWCGVLSIEDTMDAQGMAEEPGCCLCPPRRITAATTRARRSTRSATSPITARGCSMTVPCRWCSPSTAAATLRCTWCTFPAGTGSPGRAASCSSAWRII